MVWSPTYKTVRPREIVPNLFTFFQTNQADALLWAHGTALKTFQQFSDGVQNRANPLFPAIAFKRDSASTGGDGDVQITEYSVIFEMVIQNRDPAAAVAQARSYVAAVTSMILNIPDDDLIENTDAVKVVTSEIADNFGEIKTVLNKDYFQEFEVGATFSLTAGVYE